MWKHELVLPHIELQKGCIVPEEKTSVQRVSVAADMKNWAQVTAQCTMNSNSPTRPNLHHQF